MAAGSNEPSESASQGVAHEFEYKVNARTIMPMHLDHVRFIMFFLLASFDKGSQRGPTTA
jgi:hypothetical protein